MPTACLGMLPLVFSVPVFIVYRKRVNYRGAYALGLQAAADRVRNDPEDASERPPNRYSSEIQEETLPVPYVPGVRQQSS